MLINFILKATLGAQLKDISLIYFESKITLKVQMFLINKYPNHIDFTY